MTAEALAPRTRPIVAWCAFATAAALAAAIAAWHPYVARLLSMRTWQRLHLGDFPARGVLLVVVLVAAASLALYLARRAPDARTLLAVLMVVAMQTTGITLGPFNLLIVLPLFTIAFVLTQALLRPSMPVPVTSVTFFALLLLLLDMPYLANLNIYGPARFIVNFLSALKAFAVAIAMIMIVERESTLRVVLKALVAVGIVSAIIGVGQMLLVWFAGITFSLVTPEHQTKAAFLGTTLRASGLTTWSQHLADYLVLVVPFALFRLADSGPGKQWVAWFLALATMVLAVVFTFTYAGYFALAAVFLVFPFMRWPHRAAHFALAIVAALTLAYAAGGADWVQDMYTKRVASSSGLVERRVYLDSTLEEIARNPLLGSGFYAEEEFSGNFYRKRVHSMPLQAWADLGLAGLLVFIAMMLTTYTQLWMAVASARERAWRRRFQALALGMTGMLVAMIVEANLTVPHTWFMLGLAASAIRIWSLRAPQAVPE